MNATPATVFGNRKKPSTPEKSGGVSNGPDQEYLDKAAFLAALGVTPSNEPTPADLAPNPEDSLEPAEPETFEKSNEFSGKLGNPELPIADFREEIVGAVDRSQATIITAETGAGKSTQVPQFLAEQGYKVVMTQPRIVAARTVSERIGDEVKGVLGDEAENFVGYRTADERGDHPDNQILAVTDGLQLVRELSRKKNGEKTVLVLDEVHEWNVNMEILVAYAKKRMKEDPNFKLVVMSATMESQSLSEYFSDDEHEAPVIEVPGRTYEVEMHEGGDLEQTTIELARQGKNTLVFVPGKQEIARVMRTVKASVPDAVVLPLHGSLDSAEQRKAFQKYGDRPKIIVATNVAQTSITIDDIDAVVDSGLENQSRVQDGVEGLYVNLTSKADCEQRAGRAGRTGPGEYYLCRLRGSGEFVPLDQRPAYPTPEIERSSLDSATLKLASAGLDIEEMNFYHQPNPEEIAASKVRLQKLGALDENGKLTKIGRQIERLPLEVHYARMMVEARKFSPEVQMQLAAALALQEMGGIRMFSTKDNNIYENWKNLPGVNLESGSDIIDELSVYAAALQLNKDEMFEYEINVKNFGKARDLFRRLRDKLNLRIKVADIYGSDGKNDAQKFSSKTKNKTNEYWKVLLTPTSEQREQLRKCIVAGMVDSVWRKSSYYAGTYVNTKESRRASNRSNVKGEVVVGSPYNIDTARGTMQLLTGMTCTSVEELCEIAPQLVEYSDPEIENYRGRLVWARDVRFNGMEIGRTREGLEPGEDRKRAYAFYAVRRSRSSIVGDIDDEVKKLRGKSGINIPPLADEAIIDALAAVMPDELDNIDDVWDLKHGLTILDVLPQEMIDEINKNSPDEYDGMRLTYTNGVPYAKISAKEVAGLAEEYFALPDGREIRRPSGYYDEGWQPEQSLAELRELGVNQLEDEKIKQRVIDLKNIISAITIPEEFDTKKFELLSWLDEIAKTPQDGFDIEGRLGALDEAEEKVTAFQQEVIQMISELELKQKINSKLNEAKDIINRRLNYPREFEAEKEKLLGRIEQLRGSGTLTEATEICEKAADWSSRAYQAWVDNQPIRRERRGAPRGRRGYRSPRTPRSRGDVDVYDPDSDGSSLVGSYGGDNNADADGASSSGSMDDMLAALQARFNG